MLKSKRPQLFLAVQRGDLVVVQSRADWWMGHVIHVEGNARSSEPSLFQVACIDTGAIRTVNADAVVAILQAAEAGTRDDSGPLQPPDDHAHQHQRSSQSNQQGNRHGQARRIG